MIVKILIFNSFQFIEHRLKATSGVEYIFIYIKFEHKLAMVPLEKMQSFNIEKESTFSTYTDIFAVILPTYLSVPLKIPSQLSQRILSFHLQPQSADLCKQKKLFL